MRRYKYFTPKELECNCGCGLMNMRDLTMRKADRARELAGVSFVINSACRCRSWNMREGGSLTSSHLDGYALDIAASHSAKRFKVLTALIQAGFNRIGIAKTFIHVDDDPTKPAGIVFLY